MHNYNSQERAASIDGSSTDGETKAQHWAGICPKSSSELAVQLGSSLRSPDSRADAVTPRQHLLKKGMRHELLM